MTDRYENIRKALAMGPTPGPWVQDGDGVSAADEDVAVAMCCPSDAEAAYIAAADPDTIAALLKERDALRDALSEAQTRIAAIGYPASPDGEYSKDGEWTFSDAVPRAVDAGEVKAAFLVLRAALAEWAQS